MAKQKKETVSIAIRFPLDIKAKLDIASEKEMLSINSYVLKSIQEKIDRDSK